ncbi:transposable element Tcb1 transposase [Trichonephila clavipes]|nr:transposable element Tcb1 transposase [Trichonephila clavipes]
MLNSSVMYRHTGHASSIMIWGGIGYHFRTPLVRIVGTLNSQRYISEVLELVVLPCLQGLATTVFQQDNARPHVARIVQRFFVNHQIKLLSWPARSPDLSEIENMWSMVAHRLTQITPQLPYQINFGNVWKLLGLLYPKNTSKVSLNQCRGAWQRTNTPEKKNCGFVPLDEDDLIEFMTVYYYREVDNDEVEGEAQLLTADLILEGLKFAISTEQYFFTHDPDVEHALEFQRNHKFCVVGYQE